MKNKSRKQVSLLQNIVLGIGFASSALSLAKMPVLNGVYSGENPFQRNEKIRVEFSELQVKSITGTPVEELQNKKFKMDSFKMNNAGSLFRVSFVEVDSQNQAVPNGVNFEIIDSWGKDDFITPDGAILVTSLGAQFGLKRE